MHYWLVLTQVLENVSDAPGIVGLHTLTKMGVQFGLLKILFEGTYSLVEVFRDWQLVEGVPCNKLSLHSQELLFEASHLSTNTCFQSIHFLLQRLIALFSILKGHQNLFLHLFR